MNTPAHPPAVSRPAWTAHETELLLNGAIYGKTKRIKNLLAMLPRKRPHNILQDALWNATEGGHAACVELLAAVCTQEAKIAALRRSAHQGSSAVAAILAPLVPPAAATDALVEAARCGHTACLKILLPFYEPVLENNTALSLATFYGHTECVRVLLENTSMPLTNVHQNALLRTAARANYPECLKLLLPHCNARADHSKALQEAVIYGHTECARILFPASDAAQALAEIKTDYRVIRQEWTDILQHLMAAQQSEKIHAAIGEKAIMPPPVHRAKL